MTQRSGAGSSKPRRRKPPAAKRRGGVEAVRGATSTATKEELRFALLRRSLSEARWHHRRAEEALWESEYKLRQIIESAVPGMLCVTGPDGEVTRVNQRTLDFTGAALLRTHELSLIGVPACRAERRHRSRSSSSTGLLR